MWEKLKTDINHRYLKLNAITCGQRKELLSYLAFMSTHKGKKKLHYFFRDINVIVDEN